MYSLPSGNKTLFDRIETIEKQNRRLKSSVVLLALLLLPIALMGAKSGPLDGEFRQIATQKISIVDGTGKEVMRRRRDPSLLIDQKAVRLGSADS